MNCSDRIYHKNEFGLTRKCECHGAVHVVFGTVSLLLSRLQLREFATYIGEAIWSECDVEDHNERCIYLPTRDYALMFVMTYNELKSLSELLDQTLLMMEIDDALTFNKQ